MKATLEDYLQSIDGYFLGKSQKDVYMTYIMVFSVIFAFGYLLFWDASEAEFKAKRAQVVTIEKKIQQDNLYLKQNPLSKIMAIERDTKIAQAKIVDYKKNNQYIKDKIEEISSLIYDDQTWGEYLHSISKNAKANSIKILNLTNKYANNKDTFGHILDINVEAYGSYSDTINYINSLEQSDLVVDMHTFNLEASNTLNSNLSISVWGITY